MDRSEQLKIELLEIEEQQRELKDTYLLLDKLREIQVHPAKA